MMPDQRPLNAMHLQDHVAKACHWSDGGSEFVFVDGTVLSFTDEMKAFVAVHAAKPNQARDMMMTSLCLSTYAAKVRAALEIYNRFAVRPRLIYGLHNGTEAIWRKSSPIEALVLVNDPSLFSRRYVCCAETTTTGSAALSQDATPPPYHMTLQCAMRKVALTVHPTRELFLVSWPARVCETDGSTSIFVPPMAKDAYAAHTALASQRACRYVTLTQWFVMDLCPPEWDAMVRMCFEMDRMLPHTHIDSEAPGAGSNTPPQEQPCSTQVSLTTPTPLGAPRVPSGMSSYVASRAACYNVGPTDGPSSSSVRFSDIQPEDAHAFVAATHLHNCPPQQRLHGATSTVAWRYDADPTGRCPAAWYRSWVEPGGGAVHCTGLVQEDDAVVRGVRGGVDHAHTNLLTMRVVLRRSPPSTGNDDQSASQNVDAAAVVMERREYVQDTALSFGMPRTLNTGLCTPLLGPVGALLHGDAPVDESTPRVRQRASYATAEAFGRYLPSTAETVVSILGRQLCTVHDRSASMNAQRTTAMHASEGRSPNDDHADSSSVSQRAVKFTSRIDGVGTFTALTNGVVRGAFDDRVLLALIPDASDSEEGLVCEMRGRDGEVRVMRAVQCLPTHDISEYLRYLLPFRRFARMSPDDQRALAFCPSAADTGLQYQLRSGPTTGSRLSLQPGGAAGMKTDAAVHAPGAAECSGQRHHVSSLDVVVMNVSGSISMSESIRNKSVALLQQL